MSSPTNPNDPSAPLREALALLESPMGSVASHSPKELRDLILACQKSYDAHGTRAASRRKDILEGIQYVGGLLTIIAVIVVFVAFYPSEKRDVVIDKLIPFVTGIAGILFGKVVLPKKGD